MPHASYSELDGKRIGLWGLGLETLSFARRLPELAPSATIVAAVSDAPQTTAPPELAGIPVGGEDTIAASFADVDLVVRSPGVSIYRPELQQLVASGTHVTTATALWFKRPHPAPVVAVTGTKGKSTTASLIAHLFAAAGVRAELAGNIGRPALELEFEPVPEFYVIELSSYHTADLAVGAETVVFTNLHKEHATWHGDGETYFADKLRLARLPQLERAVVNAEDARLMRETDELPRVLYGSSQRFHVAGDGVVRDGEPFIAAGQFPLPGRHNLLNLCAALTTLEALGTELATDQAAAALADFSALPHRLEAVPTGDGILWIDDSISTTPESSIAAIEAFAGRPIVLLAGGHDRGQDYAALCEKLRAIDAAVICLPETGSRIEQQAEAAGVAEAKRFAAADLTEAVGIARGLVPANGVVLLSPGAPSFAQFNSYAERGDLFSALARAGS
ncbi:MAG: UDP-N-acetylmuramoyl-L-alanine--D-glutamate ligase [Solirubrobacterales bacterium]